MIITCNINRDRYRYQYTCTQMERTALVLASCGGHTECIRLLVEAGADTELSDQVRANLLYRPTPCICRVVSTQCIIIMYYIGLFWSRCKHAHEHLILYVHTYNLQDGETALSNVAAKGDSDLVRLLLHGKKKQFNVLRDRDVNYVKNYD